MKGIWSASALRNILTCPLMFYLDRLLRSPVPYRADRAFGGMVHFCMKRFFSVRYKSFSTFLNFALGFWEGVVNGDHGPDSFSPQVSRPHDIQWIGRRDAEFYTERLVWVLWLFWEINIEMRDIPELQPEVEKHISYRFGPFSLRGTIDRLQPHEAGGVEIWDYKTWPLDDLRTVNDLQMTTYDLWYRIENGLIPRGLYIYSYYEGRDVPVPLRSDADFQFFFRLLQEATAYVRAVLLQSEADAEILDRSHFQHWRLDAELGTFCPRYVECPIPFCPHRDECLKWFEDHRNGLPMVKASQLMTAEFQARVEAKDAEKGHPHQETLILEE
ncbi:MAG: PD-(D/E)XK nuclease family protein [Patescibacteria group bacterium]